MWSATSFGKEAILPVNPGTGSNGASIEGIIDQYLTIAVTKACIYFYLAILVEVFGKLKYALGRSVLMKKILIKSECWP